MSKTAHPNKNGGQPRAKRAAVGSTDWFGDVHALSPRLLWFANHRVKTHEFVEDPDRPETFNHCGFGRWLAYVGRMPNNEDDGIWAVGDTEDEALVRLAKGMGWRLWNEELAATRPLNAKSPNVKDQATASEKR